MNVQQNTKGFTIIEVVLVLAIAGLIFLMVFIALPALQSSQRDSARKADVSTIASAVSTYTGNNRGVFPTTTQLTGNASGEPDSSGKFGGYVEAVSISTTSITVGTAGDDSIVVSDGMVVIVKGSRCGSSGTAGDDGAATQSLENGTSRQYTVTTFLEAGGGTSYCQDS